MRGTGSFQIHVWKFGILEEACPSLETYMKFCFVIEPFRTSPPPPRCLSSDSPPLDYRTRTSISMYARSDVMARKVLLGSGAKGYGTPCHTPFPRALCATPPPIAQVEACRQIGLPSVKTEACDESIYHSSRCRPACQHCHCASAYLSPHHVAQIVMHACMCSQSCTCAHTQSDKHATR